MRAALRRARELAPGEARYREELALRSLSSESSQAEADARGDEHYLVPSQTILARRKGVPAGLPDVADRQLHLLRAVVMHPDRRVSMLIHYAREIVIAPRTEDELYEDMPAEGDLVEILRARVHRKDGGTAFPTEEHNEGSRPRIRWPELEPGDVVEVAFRSWTAGPVGGRGDAPFYFLDYAGAFASNPMLYNEDVVETPPDRQLYLDVLHGGDYQRTEKDENGHHVVRLVWDHPPILPDEPLAPQAERGRPDARRLDVQGLGRLPRLVRRGRARLHRARRRRCGGSPPSSRRARGRARRSCRRSSTSSPTTSAT